MTLESPPMRTYRVNRKDREPLVEFIKSALEECGCQIINASTPDEAPFKITFETPLGERLGIVAYAFLANNNKIKNRPPDEHRFQLKYGSDDKGVHRLWQDPYGLYVTLLVGVNPKQKFFVGVDPVLHSPTRFFISLEFKQCNVDEILKTRWTSWEREVRGSHAGPVEILVGGTARSFLRYVRFEREGLGEDQGHRALLAEKLSSSDGLLPLAMPSGGPTIVPAAHLHALAREFEMTEAEVLDLIAGARRLKMAVRGWVAEEHLVRRLQRVSDVTDCRRLDQEGGADVSLLYRGRGPITIECKNVLRRPTANGLARVDFQRTRASMADPCSRYYRPEDFDVVAACTHAVTEQWEFKYVLPSQLDIHPKCVGRLSQGVHVDGRWKDDAASVLDAAIS